MHVINEKVAVVTGGVSGIGAELTRGLVKKGWKVAAFDIAAQASLGQKLSEELQDSFVYFQCDITKYDEQATAFSNTFKKWGRIDAFCANAGIIDRGSIYILKSRGKTDVPPEPDLACTDVCFKAVIYGTQLAIHFMRQNPIPGGFIIATSSMVGIHPIASFPEYCAAKAAVVGFVRSVAPFLKLRENISVNAVCPGVTPTQFIDQEMRDTFGEGNLTPISTIVAAFIKCLEDHNINGEILEGSRTNILVLGKPEYADGEVTKRTCTVYDPFFKAIHGEPSGLEEIVRRKN